MQPYFFPYLGHFALIAHTDRWVVFDVTQYSPKSWMNRNRVLHPSSGWMYVTVPVGHPRRAMVSRDVRVVSMQEALSTVLGKLSHYAKKAPFAADVAKVVVAAFHEARDDTLVQLNLAGLRAVCRYIGLEFEYSICSQLDADLAGIEHPGDWAPVIAHAVGATTYVNPTGGKHLFDPEVFRRRHIELRFLEMPSFTYETPRYQFERDLSILDVLMWNPPASIRAALCTARVTGAGTGQG